MGRTQAFHPNPEQHQKQAAEPYDGDLTRVRMSFMVSVLNLSPTRDVSTAERMSEYDVEPCSCGAGEFSSTGRRNEKTTGAS